MKDRIGCTRTVSILNHFKVSDAADAIGTHVDIGNARTGLLIITTRGATSCKNVGLFTSDSNTFLTKSTAKGVGLLARLTQDTVNSTATVTINSDYVIANLNNSYSGVFIFNADRLQRYVNIQFDPSASDTAAAPKMITATLVADDLAQAPYAAATSSY